MAVTADILSLYDVGGSTLKGSGPLKEQLLPQVYNVDPDETPFLSLLPTTNVNGPLVQWLTDSLPSDSNIPTGEVDGNEAPDGGSYKTNVVPSRDDNVVMSLRADLSIADDVLEADQAGYENALAYHLSKWEKVWYIKQEKIMLDPAVARNNGSESVARVCDNFAAKTVAAAVSTSMPAATNVSGIIEDDFNDGLQEYWQNGGKGKVCLVDMNTMRQIQATFFGLAKTVDAATGSNNVNRRTSDASSNTLYANVEFYRGVTGGVYAFVVDRWLNIAVAGGAASNANSRAFIVDRNMAAIGWYKQLRSVPLAKTGSSTKVMLRGAFTLLVYNTKAQYSFQGSA